MLSRYWPEGKAQELSRYLKKFNKSPEKLVAELEARKLYTVMEPLGPLYNFQLTPLIVVVAIADPVLEIGPAPPSAPSQTMTSYSLDPEAEEDVNIS
jgi:hypothetical protein